MSAERADVVWSDSRGNVDDHLRPSLKDDKQDTDRARDPVEFKPVVKFLCVCHAVRRARESGDVGNA